MRVILIFKYWWLKLFTRKEDMAIPVMNDRMYIHTKVDGISYALVKYGAREQDMVHIIRKVIEPGMKVLDLGGNIGYYSVILSNLVGSRGCVFSVEPDSRNYDLLCKNVVTRKNVSTYNIAIGDKNYVAKLGVTKKSNLNSFIENIGKGDVSYQNVRMLTLESFLESEIKDKVNFIRMDIEGFEYEVLNGSIDYLLNYQESLSILLETHPNYYSKQRPMDALVKRMMEFGGFELKYLVGSANSSSIIFNQFGLKSDYVIKADGYERPFYMNLSNIEIITELLVAQPKLVRYILLSRNY